MNKRILITTLALFIGGIFISSAQVDTRIGAMLAYGTEIDQPGIGVNAEFGISEKFSVAPSFLYYFPDKGSGITINWWELNADAHYYFLDSDGFTVFGLAGINYTSVKLKSKFSGSSEIPAGLSRSYSDGKVGLNIGAGANLELDGIVTPFAELKYVISDADHLLIGAGVRIDI